MEESITIKRFSVFINGLLCGVFETIEEARTYTRKNGGVLGIATIWDNESRDEILTEIKI